VSLQVKALDAAPRRAGSVGLVPGYQVDAPHAVRECMPGRRTLASCCGQTFGRPSRCVALRAPPAWLMRCAAHELGRPGHEPWHARCRPRTPGHTIEHLNDMALREGFEAVCLKPLTKVGSSVGLGPTSSSMAHVTPGVQ
jgi:hypothetical protein